MCNTADNIKICEQHGLKVEMGDGVIIVNGKPVYDYVFDFLPPESGEIIEFLVDKRGINVNREASCHTH